MNYSKEELELMRQSCKIAADTLCLIDDNICEGISTLELDEIVNKFLEEKNAYPSPLNYKSFPKSICTSVNGVACHGIPNKQEILRNGDIINVDISTFYPKKSGFHGDTSATFYIGQPDPEAIKIVETARECLNVGIEMAKPGNRVGDIGHAIEECAKDNGCFVAKDFIGHGVGRYFHGPPSIYHYGKPGEGVELTEGMTFTIEPIINIGSGDCAILSDGWTVITKNNTLSAQFEHTILITKDGNEILTKRKKPLKNSEKCYKL